MGRKRTSKKKKITISVDNDIYERLVELEVNRSILFTDAALIMIEELKAKKEQNGKE